jgi:hypothetical protein
METNMATANLQEYIISYSKSGFTAPLTPAGLADFRKEVEAMRTIAIVGTDYADRVDTCSPLTMLSFLSRPDEKTLSFHRVWSDKTAGDDFYAKNETTVFENFRKNGWTVTCTSRLFDPSELNGSDITLL